MQETLSLEMETDEDRSRKRPREEHAAEGNDAAVRALERITSSGGGVTDRKHIPALLAALAEEKRDKMRKIFLVVVERSSDEVKKQLVAQPEGTSQCGIQTIDTWANEAQSTPSDTDIAEYLRIIIRVMASLPMELECLKRTKVGKTIGALRKHANPDVASAAKDLVEKWRLLAEPGGGREGGLGGQGASVKKPTKPPLVGPSSIPPSSSGEPPAAKKARVIELKVDVSGAPQSTPGQPSPSTGLTPSPSSATHAATLSEGRKAIAPGDKSSHLGEDETTKEVPPRVNGASPKASSSTAAPPVKEPSSHDAKKAPPSSESTAPKSKLGSFPGPNSGGSNVPPVRLGSLKDTPMGMPSPVRPPPAQGASSQGHVAPETVKERAARLRASVPSPDPPEVGVEKKVKKKSVRWVQEESLINIRWFKKEEPPMAAKSDSLFEEDAERQQGKISAASHSHHRRSQGHRGLSSDPSTSAARGHGIAGFESETRREHRYEREALEALHHREEEERRELQERVLAMFPQQRWARLDHGEGLPLFYVDPEWQVAYGEQSEEKRVQEERKVSLPRIVYPTEGHVPPSPYEPVEPEPEPDYRYHPVLLIPLDLPPPETPLPAASHSVPPSAPSSMLGSLLSILPPHLLQQQQQGPYFNNSMQQSQSLAAPPAPAINLANMSSLLASLSQSPAISSLTSHPPNPQNYQQQPQPLHQQPQPPPRQQPYSEPQAGFYSQPPPLQQIQTLPHQPPGISPLFQPQIHIQQPQSYQQDPNQSFLYQQQQQQPMQMQHQHQHQQQQSQPMTMGGMMGGGNWGQDQGGFNAAQRGLPPPPPPPPPKQQPQQSQWAQPPPPPPPPRESGNWNGQQQHSSSLGGGWSSGRIEDRGVSRPTAMDSRAHGGGKNVCVFYNLPVGCKRGESCQFAHVTISEEELRERMKSMPPGPGRGMNRR